MVDPEKYFGPCIRKLPDHEPPATTAPMVTVERLPGGCLLYRGAWGHHVPRNTREQAPLGCPREEGA